MRSWRIRGIGGIPAAEPDPPPAPARSAVPDRPAPSDRPAVPDRPEPSDRPTSDRPVSDRPVSDRPASDRPALPDRPVPASDRRASTPGLSASGSDRHTAVPGQRLRNGSPFADAVRGVPPCPLRVRSAPECADLDRVLSQVREIAVWAGNQGRVQDTGRFLLLDGERVWHSVAFGDEQGTELIARMRTIPGFDTNVLLDAVSHRSGQIEPLWPPRAVSATRR